MGQQAGVRSPRRGRSIPIQAPVQYCTTGQGPPDWPPPCSPVRGIAPPCTCSTPCSRGGSASGGACQACTTCRGGGGGAQGMAGMAWQRRSAMLASPRGDARMGDRRASVHSRRLGLAAERPKGAALVDSGRRHRPGWTPQHAAPRRSLAAIRPARDAWLAGRCLGAGAFAAPEFRSLGRPGPALLPAGSHPAAAAAAAAPGAAASRCARWGGRPPRRTAGAAQSRPCTAGRVGASRVGPDALLQPSVTLWAAPCPI